MKAIFIILLPVLCFSQTETWPMDDGVITFSRVIECDLSKDQIYSLSRSWMVDHFRSADNVIQFDDKEMGKIEGKGYSDYSGSSFDILECQNWYTISILIKDDKAKIVIDNLLYSVKTITKYGSVHMMPAESYFQSKKSFKANGELRSIPKTIRDVTHQNLTDLIDSYEQVLTSDQNEFDF